MSKGKYSPYLPNANKANAFKYNSYGDSPAPWTHEIAASGVVYDMKTMFDSYDEDGFNSYGYSEFSLDGKYIGAGAGVDRLGYTEDDYRRMSDEEFNSL